MLTKPNPLAKAHEAIGEYFCAFSQVEHELGEAIKVIFKLENNDASDGIVGAIYNFATKADLVLTASKVAKNINNGSDPGKEWHTKAEVTISKAKELNYQDRALGASASTVSTCRRSMGVGMGSNGQYCELAFQRVNRGL